MLESAQKMLLFYLVSRDNISKIEAVIFKKVSELAFKWLNNNLLAKKVSKMSYISLGGG